MDYILKSDREEFFTNKYRDAFDHLETITTKTQTVDDMTYAIPNDQKTEESFEALQELVDKSEPRYVEFNNVFEAVKVGYLYKCPTCGSYFIGLMKRPCNDEIVRENYCNNCTQYLDWSLVGYIEDLKFKR